MLQRIQSVLLFFAALCMLAILYFPMWEKADVDKNEKVSLSSLALTHEKVDIETTEINMLAEQWTGYIAILAVLAAAVAFYSIFRYDNRLFQIKLGALNSLLMGGCIGTSVYFALQAESMIVPEVRGDYLTGFYLGVVALLLNSMANRFIRKDERLVRSADRIR
ncbi:MAG: DUF4293 domain-containing protein [Reichenbachiella sp.]